MVERKSTESQLAEIMSRLDRIETRLGERIASETAHGNDDDHATAQRRYCAVPPAPPRKFEETLSPDRMRAIIDLGNKWVNGTPLHYYFYTSGSLGGASSQQDVVRQAFKVWKNIGIGLTFTEVMSPGSAEVRIGFDHSDGSWSRVGKDVLNAAASEQTMNFGWNLNVPGPNGLDTAVHEIGHTLGLHHEHQNPNAGIVWNKQAVYDYFFQTQNPPWSHATTDFNILDKIAPQTVSGTTWDPDSIMHYAFAAGLIKSPVQYQGGLTPAGGLSDRDKQVIRQFYPAGGGAVTSPHLAPGESQILDVDTGDQKDFDVVPSESRKYTFQTFGEADTVMVLFEDDAGRLRYMAGDDDSGSARNAKLEVRLHEGRKYRLKIRLHYRTSAAHPAVMMW